MCVYIYIYIYCIYNYIHLYTYTHTCERPGINACTHTHTHFRHFKKYNFRLISHTEREKYTQKIVILSNFMGIAWAQRRRKKNAGLYDPCLRQSVKVLIDIV